MKPINSLSLDKDLILKLKEVNINNVEDLWSIKRSDLKSKKFTNDEINKIIISLQLIGLDLNKRKY